MDAVNWQEIRQLVTLLDQTSVAELTLELGDLRLAIRKSAAGSLAVVAPEIPPPAPVVSQPPPLIPQLAESQIGSAPLPDPPAKTKTPPAHWIEVKAPMVGTFYRAPAPNEPEFIQLGDRVLKGQALCIIEAMKLMNELEAEAAGRVVEITVNNNQPVEFGQVLMRIDPQA